jgi:hypothetical protein
MALNADSPEYRELVDLALTGETLDSYGGSIFDSEFNSQSPEQMLTSSIDTTSTANKLADNLFNVSEGGFAIPHYGSDIAMETPTSLDLNRRQYSAEKRATKEYNKIKALMTAYGQGDEFEEYISKRGPEGSFLTGGTNEFERSRMLNDVFDTLSAGNYAAAGFVDSLISGRSTFEAFRQAAVNLGNALPVLRGQFKDAEKIDFDDVFNRNNIGGSGTAAVAFLLDVFLDPINLIPGAAVGTAIGKTGKGINFLIDKTGPLGRTFDEVFRPTRKFDVLGEGGEQFTREQDYAEAYINNQLPKMVERVESITADMTPDERTLFGLFLDQPEVLEQQLKVLVDKGLLPEDRLNFVSQIREKVNAHTRSLFEIEADDKFKLLDESLFRDNYLPAYLATDPNLRKGYAQLKNVRRPVHKVPTTEEKARFLQPKKYPTNEELFKDVLSGSLRNTTLELDLHNILLKRSFEHTRWIANRKFINAVINNKSLMPDGKTPFSIDLFDPSLDATAMIPGRTKTYAEAKVVKDLLRDNPTHELFEVTRKTIDEKGNYVDEIVSAHLLPSEVVQHMKAGDTAFARDDGLYKFFEFVEGLTSPWRAYATLSPGFHARNYIGMLFTNWLRGVGNARDVGTDIASNYTLSKGGMTRAHLQAFAIQRNMKGAGEMPGLFNKIQGMFGGKDLESLEFTEKIAKLDSKGNKVGVYTPQEIADLAQQYDVPQSISHFGPMGENLDKMPEAMKMDKLTSETANLEGLSGSAQEALRLQGEAAAAGKSVGDRAYGMAANNRLIKANRATATIFENNGRMALFIDRLKKGDSPEIAALETKKWHFDYRKLSKIERSVFANMMPFYAWSRFAMPRMALAVLENPARMSKVPKFQNLIQNIANNTGMGEFPTPDYYDELQAIQVPSFDAIEAEAKNLFEKIGLGATQSEMGQMFDEDGYPVYASMDLPILELNRLNVQDIGSSLSPVFKPLIERATGQSLFTGTPIETFPGEEERDVRAVPKFITDALGIESTDRITKSQRHLVGAINPAVERYWFRTFQDMPARNQLMYSLLRELGPNVRPLDVRRTMRGRNFETLKLAREFKQRFLQEQANIAEREAELAAGD